MSVIVINHRYELRYGDASEWSSTTVLREGEPGIEGDTGKWKVGDGVTPWGTLPYMVGEVSGGGAVDSVNGQTGVVVLDATDIGAVATVNGEAGPTVTLSAADVGAVVSVNGETGVVSLSAADVGAVVSVNGETGVVSLSSADVGADAAGTAAAAVSAFSATLGDSAVLDVGTTAGTVAAGNDSRFPMPKPYVFHVATYGAVGDNSTNDRGSIQDCIDAAVAYALANQYYAEVHFDPKTYYLGSAAPSQDSGSENGNWGRYAMLGLPAVPQTGRKLVIKFVGAGPADGMLHWLQETPQRAGTVLRANPTGLGLVTINGRSNIAPSIIGGPLFATGNTWSNLYFIMDGISIITPENTGIMGVDLKEIANARIETIGGMVEATVGGVGGNASIGAPTNDLAMFLRMPELGNNDLSYIDSMSVEGWFYALAPGDHCHVNRLAAIYCDVAIFIGLSGTYDHGVTMNNVSIEACQSAAIQAGQSSGSSMPLFIQALHEETAAGFLVDDAGGYLKGEIHIHAITQVTPSLNGAGGLRIINERIPAGSVTGTIGGVSLPSVPATTVALTNPYYRDAAVTVTGGTVTQIAVDGQNKGITSGTVIVPSGSTIAITYSSAPTWTWTLL